MTVFVNRPSIGGLRTVSQILINRAGVWKPIQQGWVNQAGVWKQFYASLASVIANSGVAQGESDPAVGTSGTAGAELLFKSDGSILAHKIAGAIDNSTGSSAWLASIAPGNGAAYWMRATQVSGNSSLTSGTTGAWLQLNSNRSFQLVHGARSGGFYVNLSIDFATDAAGSNIVSSGNTWNVSAVIAPG